MRNTLFGLLVTVCARSLLAAPAQPELETRARKIITVKGFRFKGLNANGRTCNKPNRL